MELKDFLAKLKLAHDVPNYYNNHYPKNLGYYDGNHYSFGYWNIYARVIKSSKQNTQIQPACTLYKSVKGGRK